MHTEIVETPLGQYETFTGDLITQALKRFGGKQRADLAMAKSQLRPGDIVLDVGAHIGTFAIPFARAVQPDGRVFAFEPVPETVEVLGHNVEFNAAAVTPVHAVVSDRRVAMRRTDVRGNTQGTFFEPLGHDDSGSLATTIVLDDFCAEKGLAGRLGLIKVDVEGMELQVLRGADRVIAEHRPAIVAEVNRRHLARVATTPADLDALFSEHGYHLFMNVGARNPQDDHFTLGRLPALRLLGLGGDSLRVVDVLAVHPDSERYPANAAGRRLTLERIAAACGRAVIRRAKRLANRS